MDIYKVIKYIGCDKFAGALILCFAVKKKPVICFLTNCRLFEVFALNAKYGGRESLILAECML